MGISVSEVMEGRDCIPEILGVSIGTISLENAMKNARAIDVQQRPSRINRSGEKVIVSYGYGSGEIGTIRHIESSRIGFLFIYLSELHQCDRISIHSLLRFENEFLFRAIVMKLSLHPNLRDSSS